MKFTERVAAYLQGSEVDLMAAVAWRVRNACKFLNATMLLTWHDAIYCECKPEQAETLARELKEEGVGDELLKDMILEANGGAGVNAGVTMEQFRDVLGRAGVF